MKKEHKKHILFLIWLCTCTTGLLLLTGCGFGCGNSCLGFTISCGKNLSDGSKVNYLDLSLFGETSDFFSVEEGDGSILGCDTVAGSNCNCYVGCFDSKERNTDVCYYGCGSCACARGEVLGRSAPCVTDGEFFGHLGESVKKSLEEEGY